MAPISLAILLSAVVLSAQSAIENYLRGWYLLAGDKGQATFALASSVRGESEARSLTAKMISRNTQRGVKHNIFKVSINCSNEMIAYTSNEAFSTTGVPLGPIALPSRKAQVARKGSVGEYLVDFACKPWNAGVPDVGYPVMLEASLVADHFFRFLGLGLSADAAGSLAAVDAERAPKNFNDLLNVMVPADRQDLVRAIKTPNALAD